MAAGSTSSSVGVPAGPSGLGPVLAAAQQLVAAASDRGALLVAQDLRMAVAAMLAAGGVVGPQLSQAHDSWAHVGTEWLERACSSSGGPGGGGTSLSAVQLLPERSDASGSGGGVCASLEAVMLWRLRRLAVWEASAEYAALVKGAPLLLQPAANC